MKAYAVSSGAYSDYSVWCLFEREEDAIDYCRRIGNDMEFYEPWKEWHAMRVVADGRREPTYDGPRIESFDFYPAGVIPALKDG